LALRVGCRDPCTDGRAEPRLLDAPGGWWVLLCSYLKGGAARGVA
jgi:hypothetical protein